MNFLHSGQSSFPKFGKRYFYLSADLTSQAFDLLAKLQFAANDLRATVAAG
jgi:hypothetical protein